MGLLRYFLLSIAMSQHSIASENIPDQYPQSVLYSKPSEFIPNVFSAIGATAPPTYENSGHNNNFTNLNVVIIRYKILKSQTLQKVIFRDAL